MLTFLSAVTVRSLSAVVLSCIFLFQSNCNQADSSHNLLNAQKGTDATSNKSTVISPANLEINPTDQYLVYYDSLDEKSKLETVIKADFKLIILAQNSLSKDVTVRKAQISQLKNGGKTQVVVYLSIGEDDQCQHITDETKKLKCGQDSPAKDKRGPVYWKNGERVYEEKDYPSYLVDGKGTWSEKDGKKYLVDGRPDYNGVFGGFYVDAGNSEWQESTRKRAEELLSAGFDGLFLDTLDTADTDYWYPETQSGMLDLIQSLRDLEIGPGPVKHPIIIANRGLFFFNSPECKLCQNISGVMLENYFTSEVFEEKRGDYSKDYIDGTNQKILANLIKKQEQFKSLKVLILDYVYSNQKKPKCKELLDNTLKAYDKDKIHLPFYISSSLESLPELTSEGKLDYKKKWCK